MNIRKSLLLCVAVAGLVVLGACTAGQVRKNLAATDQRIEQLDKGKAAAEQVVSTTEPILNFLPEAEKAKAIEAIRLARETLAAYEPTRAAYVSTRDELLEKLKDAKDEDSATWATIGTVASNAVTAIFSPGGLLAVGISLITGIGGLIKGRKNAEKDTKTLVNAVDALKIRVPAVAEAISTNKDIFLTTLSPKAWDLVESERTT